MTFCSWAETENLSVNVEEILSPLAAAPSIRGDEITSESKKNPSISRKEEALSGEDAAVACQGRGPTPVVSNVPCRERCSFRLPL